MRFASCFKLKLSAREINEVLKYKEIIQEIVRDFYCNDRN